MKCIEYVRVSQLPSMIAGNGTQEILGPIDGTAQN